jgi:enoyl-CoA hydratase/carnithine racemase
MRSVAVRVADGVALAVIENSFVNALNVSVGAGIMQALDRARRQADIRAMVLAAKGRTFVAGADITEFGKPPLSRTLGEVIAALVKTPNLSSRRRRSTALRSAEAPRSRARSSWPKPGFRFDAPAIFRRAAAKCKSTSRPVSSGSSPWSCMAA